MKIVVCKSPEELGRKAGFEAARLIQDSVNSKGYANVILATGTSQFETLKHLVNSPTVNWTKVTMFHLDEYIGISETHPASFRKYLRERFISNVSINKAHLINGEVEPTQECLRLAKLLSEHPTDVALVGIGENGHLAFNDPPADFETEKPYIIVELDEACRRQQMGEGWFKTLDDVPTRAISMSIKQILKSNHIICSVPDARKARAVKNTIENSINPMYPATALQSHANCTIYLDSLSASQLTNKQ